MKLYTKTGDDGQTVLFNGARVGKDHLRIDAYGTVDELNSVIGLAICGCEQDMLRDMLIEVQNHLFEVGADLATPLDAAKPAAGPVPRIDESAVSAVEQAIDRFWEPLPEMKHFVLPGGTELAARLHMARTISRRAERLAVALSRLEDIGPHLVVYLNRLSDLFFAMARWANHRQGVADVPWRGAGK